MVGWVERKYYKIYIQNYHRIRFSLLVGFSQITPGMSHSPLFGIGYIYFSIYIQCFNPHFLLCFSLAYFFCLNRYPWISPLVFHLLCTIHAPVVHLFTLFLCTLRSFTVHFIENIFHFLAICLPLLCVLVWKHAILWLYFKQICCSRGCSTNSVVTDRLIESSLSSISSKHLHSKTVIAREPKLWEKVHMLHVSCHVYIYIYICGWVSWGWVCYLRGYPVLFYINMCIFMNQ